MNNITFSWTISQQRWIGSHNIKGKMKSYKCGQIIWYNSNKTILSNVILLCDTLPPSHVFIERVISSDLIHSTFGIKSHVLKEDATVYRTSNK